MKKLNTTKSANKSANKNARTTRSTKRATTKRTPKVLEEVDPIRNEWTRSELYAHLAEVASDSKTEIQPKHVSRVFKELIDVVHAHLAKRGAGKFKIPGIGIIVRKDVPAKRVPAQKGGERRMSFGREIITEKRAAYVKPATTRVKFRANSVLKRSLLPN